MICILASLRNATFGSGKSHYFQICSHPWKDILFGQMKEAEEDAKLTESTNNQDMKSKIQVRFPLYREIRKQNSINS